MRPSIRPLATLVAIGLVLLMPVQGASAGDSKDRSRKKAAPPQSKDSPDTTAINLLDAMRDHLVSVQAEGIGDGRMTMSLTNRTRRSLRVVLPPGIVAQGATGQFGGMSGGMGGGMGGMGGMGGGMGGMGGGMGGMGGGMRSVPPTDLPSAELKPRETRRLPTRLVSLSSPDPQNGLSLPEQGERLEIIGDVGRINEDPRVQKALKRLAADKAPTTVSQLVMWRLAAGLDWDSIDRLSKRWSNAYEMTLAEDFVEHLNGLPDGETGRVFFQVLGTDAASEFLAADVGKAVKGKTVLGLMAEPGIPANPEGPAVACRVRLSASEALVQVDGTDAMGQTWVPLGKFSLPISSGQEKVDATKLTDAMVEGILNQLVRTELVKGPRAKGRLTYQIRIENASPLILNGLAALGVESAKDEAPKVLSGVSISPRRSMSLPASEEMVRGLGLKKGIRLVAIDLSGL
ncbi:MAG: hypothetical protein ACLQGP_14600 [Isosphaeraceae bacterium]